MSFPAFVKKPFLSAKPKEILGYRNVLNLIHENYQYIPLKSNYILQLHRDLLQYTELSYGGKYKTSPNEIDAVLPNGEKKHIIQTIRTL